jgi:phage tail sheath protein FI
MSATNAPGVTVNEVAVFPPSVAAVSTAIPAFIGYTAGGPTNVPTRITSMVDFAETFYKSGTVGKTTYTPAFKVDSTTGEVSYAATVTNQSHFMMHYALQMYFANGGGPCYIVSIGDYDSDVTPAVSASAMAVALPELEKVDEPTLLVFPDAQALNDNTQFYTNVMAVAMDHCHKMGDRFLIMDTLGDKDDLRNTGLPLDRTSYAAAYYPNINTSLTFDYDDTLVTLDAGADTLSSKKAINNQLYNDIRGMLSERRVVMGASAAIAGVYARTDRDRGVWKAPANVSLNSVVGPTVAISDEYNGLMNIDATAGLSINAIRNFTGKGTLVWGARTLSGNDNEWRYVPVRRFFLMVEESVQKASGRYVFEPNSIKTWVQVKSMISNFLTNQWKAGALMGNKAEDAFFVKVGLGQTMTAQDVLEGKMIIEIGMAAVRPAEFITLKFSHKMQDL